MVSEPLSPSMNSENANVLWQETFHLYRIGLAHDLIISAWFVHSLTHPGTRPDKGQGVFIWFIWLLWVLCFIAEAGRDLRGQY